MHNVESKVGTRHGPPRYLYLNSQPSNAPSSSRCHYDHPYGCAYPFRQAQNRIQLACPRKTAPLSSSSALPPRHTRRYDTAVSDALDSAIVFRARSCVLHVLRHPPYHASSTSPQWTRAPSTLLDTSDDNLWQTHLTRGPVQSSHVPPVVRVLSSQVLAHAPSPVQASTPCDNVAAARPMTLTSLYSPPPHVPPPYHPPTPAPLFFASIPSRIDDPCRMHMISIFVVSPSPSLSAQVHYRQANLKQFCGVPPTEQ
ncbi:hypothetical protein HYPSUDRAFT_208592 [Hypholoma sublateritium FD-334 SS-4]|uniref:Uncharacterized protein n=1 Tax=Hypholoma sublateritium (strain FD-334 SS-4) TaxID=945553 RepID=A0A0D2LUV0_HYPSF|nr:hypothetical protein HYPSUDRAFT_208592 [Hypholoma sublateritium FD-334 SS-4]